MSHASFVHLRVHSAFSLLEGALKTGEIPALCRGMKMPAVAITDTNNLFGALEFSEKCREAGVQPIVGCQVGVDLEMADRRGNGHTPPRDQLVLLVQDEAGYRNLLHLISQAYLEGEAGEEPFVAIGDLTERGAGLLCLTGGVAGPVGRLLSEGRAPDAEAVLAKLKTAFPGRLYVELQRHHLAAEDKVEAGLIDLAYDHALPLVATNDCYFATADTYEAHDALICVAASTFVDVDDRRRLTPEHRFKSAEEMRALFADLPEAIDNTLVVARRCAFMVESRDPILPAYEITDGQAPEEALHAQARAGLDVRLAAHVYTAEMEEAARAKAAEPYFARLDEEAGIINDMGFAGYFLIVADFIGWAREHGIPVGPGRGSGAGSVVAWALGITDLDPLRWGLLFERFLNPERVSMPDFDIDFCQERRDEVIHYVQERYGRDQVAQIITFGKLQARAVLRDVGRVLKMPYGQVDRICKLVPNNPANPVTLSQAIAGEPQLQEFRDNDPTVARLIDIALKLEGLYRHASTHAAGVVIGDRPLQELIPLYRDPRSDMPVTQFDMKSVEKAGLVKFDFLGLKTLSVIARCQELLRRRGIEIDVGTLPLDDTKTYEMLARGEAAGLFQLESSGMRDVIRRLKPDRFEDLIAVVALYRPGPMANIDSYIARKHGREEPDYLHPSLEPILKETHGIMIYQEQVMQIAQVLSGFTLGSADLLRRAMGKKIKSEMAAQRKAFVDGAVANGVEAYKAEEIFELVDRFAGYGFNKSHAAAYALVAYQTAWLKANYPVEFMAALMTFDQQNTDKLNSMRQEVDRLGIGLLPPDVNRAEADFSVEYDSAGEGAVRYALAALKNVGRAAMNALVEERTANGPFKDLADFAGRLDGRVLNKRQLESLAAAGALESLCSNRRQAYDGVETLVRVASITAEDRASGQESLFGGEDSAPAVELPEVEDWPIMERLRREFDAIGFYLSAHPLDAYGKSLERIGVLPSGSVQSTVGSGEVKRIKLAGTMIGKQERTSARGNRFAFVQFSDTDGVYEVTLFSDVLAQVRELLDSGDPLLITAEARHEDEQVKLLAQSIEPLDKAVVNAAAGLKIYLRDAAPLSNLSSVIGRQPKGRGRVSLIIDTDDREIEVALAERFAISPEIRGAIKSIPGIVDVRDV